MKYPEAKEKFIQAWGDLGSSWGINKAMAQIHALLLISTEPLTTEEIMEELKISRGNVSMNIRALLDWGIIHKENRLGERREYFAAKKDIWELAKQVSRERKRREIEPIIRILNEVQEVKGNDKDIKEFKQVTRDLKDFSSKVDGIINEFIVSDKKWLYKLLMKR